MKKTITLSFQKFSTVLMQILFQLVVYSTASWDCPRGGVEWRADCVIGAVLKVQQNLLSSRGR